jgi:hypothetical protein
MPINMVQDFRVEVDSIDLLKQYLRVAMPTALDSNQEIAVQIVDHSIENYQSLIRCYYADAHRLPVIMISGWYKPEPGKKTSYVWPEQCNIFVAHDDPVLPTNVEQAIFCIEEHLREFGPSWGRTFREKCQGPDDCDGSVGVGFGLRVCKSFPEWLAIELIYVYYHK